MAGNGTALEAENLTARNQPFQLKMASINTIVTQSRRVPGNTGSQRVFIWIMIETSREAHVLRGNKHTVLAIIIAVSHGHFSVTRNY